MAWLAGFKGRNRFWNTLFLKRVNLFFFFTDALIWFKKNGKSKTLME